MCCFLDILKTLNTKLNPTCHLLALLEAHQILHVSRMRVKARHLLIVSPIERAEKVLSFVRN
jgi:hypothetical protein